MVELRDESPPNRVTSYDIAHSLEFLPSSHNGRCLVRLGQPAASIVPRWQQNVASDHGNFVLVTANKLESQ